MPLASTSVIKLTNFPPTLPNVPPNYPLDTAPGKLELLLKANESYLYHKFSPYTNYHDSLLAPILSNKQPFVYTYIDEANNGIISGLGDTAKSLLSEVNVTQGTVNDVKRVSKFLISSWGVQFLATQLAIQRLAPFDETRIYNPLSPLLATVQPMTVGLGNRPLRHIEPIGGGLLGTALGALNSLTSTVGINLANGYSKPSSTSGGDSALPTVNVGIAGSQGKGMVRGSDAASGLLSLHKKWQTASPKGGLFSSALSSFASTIGNSFKAFFGGAPKSAGLVRADETGYWIITNGMTDLNQPWYSPGSPVKKDTNKFGTPPTYNKSTFGIVRVVKNNGPDYPKSKLISLANSFEWIDTTQGLNGKDAPPIGTRPTGYDYGDKYTDVIGQQPPSDETSLKNSDMLVQYGYYLKDSENFPTKFSDPDKAKLLNKQLKKIVDGVESSAPYYVNHNPASYLLPSDGNSSIYVGYDNWTKKKDGNGLQKVGTSDEYRSGGQPWANIKTIDQFVSKNNLRMASAFLSDGINTLGVLGGDRKINSSNSAVASNYTQANWKEWSPYEDDLIAFFFYDVVNDKYIPFRATVKAISEGNTAFWDELRFIGRADQLYSYNGFSRTLSFSFNVVINSVIELMPTWKKINYIASAVKPSNYTTGQIINQKFNRFIVPPMFMLTIGDLYKFQPMVITSINVNIPDDASWETLNQDNSPVAWSYLNGMITAPSVNKNYGQLPREAEIAITCNLLEKERAIVGGSHFGHEPRNDDWETQDGDNRFLVDSKTPYLQPPTEIHKGFVQWNNPGKSTVPPVATAPTSTNTANGGIQKTNRGGQTYTGTPGVGG